MAGRSFTFSFETMSKRLANRRRTSKRAMWLALAIFFVGQGIVGYLLDYKYPVVKFPDAGATTDRAAAEAKKPEIVFFGSSRTMTGIVTTEADKILAQEFGLSAPHTFNAKPCMEIHRLTPTPMLAILRSSAQTPVSPSRRLAATPNSAHTRMIISSSSRKYRCKSDPRRRKSRIG